MTDHKAFKREVRAVWADIRRERRARSRLDSPADLMESAERMIGHADRLKDLAAKSPAPSDADVASERPAAAAGSKAKAKAVAKGKTKSKVKGKPKKKARGKGETSEPT